MLGLGKVELRPADDLGFLDEAVIGHLLGAGIRSLCAGPIDHDLFGRIVQILVAVVDPQAGRHTRKGLLPAKARHVPRRKHLNGGLGAAVIVADHTPDF